MGFRVAIQMLGFRVHVVLTLQYVRKFVAIMGTCTGYALNATLHLLGDRLSYLNGPSGVNRYAFVTLTMAAAESTQGQCM